MRWPLTGIASAFCGWGIERDCTALVYPKTYRKSFSPFAQVAKAGSPVGGAVAGALQHSEVCATIYQALVH